MLLLLLLTMLKTATIDATTDDTERILFRSFTGSSVKNMSSYFSDLITHTLLAIALGLYCSMCLYCHDSRLAFSINLTIIGIGLGFIFYYLNRCSGFTYVDLGFVNISAIGRD